MHARFVARLRPIRTIAITAIALVVLQVFLAGLAAAQSVAVLAADGTDAGVICHGASGPEPAGGDTPDAGKVWHPCCVFCTASSAAALLVSDAARLRPDIVVLDCGASVTSFVLAANGRAVRAGSSQAPPAPFV